MVLSMFPTNLDWINFYRQVISHALFFDEVLSLNDMPENVVRLKNVVRLIKLITDMLNLVRLITQCYPGYCCKRSWLQS